MQADRPIVYILDDDSRIREALSDLLNATGYTTIAFEKAQGLSLLQEGQYRVLSHS